jgi:nucleotide-binding universal stress UspA family protein
LPLARSLARGLGARLHVCHVVEEPIALFEAGGTDAVRKLLGQADARAREEISRALDGAGAEARVHVFTDGRPADEIIERARELEIDLIVMASHGHTGLAGWILGSTTERVIRKTRIPVLVVRTPEASAR